jgi:cell division protein FtsI (penicillin-binding protein 3)
VSTTYLPGRASRSAARSQRGLPYRRRPSPSVWKAGKPRRRLVVFLLVSVALVGAVVARVSILQTVESGRYAAEGQSQRVSNVTLPADRGTIFDRNRYELALSVPQTTLWADPRAVEDKATTAAALAQVLHLDAARTATLQMRLSGENEFVYVARQVDDATVRAVEALKLKGVFTYSEPKRFHPGGSLARGLLGGVDIDGGGVGGLEKEYDSLLTGTPGELIRERDQQGRTIPSGRRQTIPAKPGKDLVLTIDKTLQYETEQLLLQQVGALEAKGGMVVVMDTRTGNVLAMASAASDPKTGRPVVASANRVVTDSYEPGSVAKIVPASAVLDLGLSTPDQLWHVPAKQKSYEYVIEDVDPHGNQDFTTTDIIAKSLNIGAVLMAQRIGSPQLDRYLRAFGFGAVSRLGLPGETAGILQPEVEWNGSQRDTISFGQGVSVTAMQVAAAMNTIANGGVYVAPRLLAGTIDQAGTDHDSARAAARRVLKPTTAAAMNRILRQVWCGGTAERAPRVAGYTVAGKTGTGYKAQNVGTKSVGNDGRVRTDGYLDRSGHYHYTASFAGFLPAEDPRITILVSIDDPPGGSRPHFGGNTAAPVFSAIASQAVQELQISPSPNGGACPAAG